MCVYICIYMYIYISENDRSIHFELIKDNSTSVLHGILFSFSLNVYLIKSIVKINLVPLVILYKVENR